MIKRFHDWIVGGGCRSCGASRPKSRQVAYRRLGLERMEERALLSADFSFATSPTMAELGDADGGFIGIGTDPWGDEDAVSSDAISIEPDDAVYLKFADPTPQHPVLRTLTFQDLLPPEHEGGMIDVAPVIMRPVLDVAALPNVPLDQGDGADESGGHALPAVLPLQQIIGEGSRGRSYAFELASALNETWRLPSLEGDETRPLPPLHGQAEPVSASDLPGMDPVPEVNVTEQVQPSPVPRPRQARQDPATQQELSLFSQRTQPDQEPVAAAPSQPVAQERSESDLGRVAPQRPDVQPPDDIQRRSAIADKPSTVNRTVAGLAAQDAVFRESAGTGNETDLLAIRVDRSRGDDVPALVAVALVGRQMIRRQGKSSIKDGRTYQIPLPTDPSLEIPIRHNRSQ